MTHMAAAEDIASDTFLAAAETWPYKGIPSNPKAWLYAVAKNKAINYLHRENVLAVKAAGKGEDFSSLPEIDLSEQNINDSQLQMLFALCHPSIPVEAQIGLSLRILCGFGINEIADAFLTNKETVRKRLSRAKEKLRMENMPIGLPGAAEIGKRLETVLTTLYLLFNEGYYSESGQKQIRKDLCLEAMRLTYLLLENQLTRVPEVYALLSLMCFHASRLDARQTENNEVILYEDQDSSLWNIELIAQGVNFLRNASQGDTLTNYHLEAGIAYWHTKHADSPEKWENILQLYNQMLQLQYSPVAALNRAYALFKVKGADIALAETEMLKLVDNHFYYTLLGVLYTGTDTKKAEENFSKALQLAKGDTDRAVIQQKLDRLKSEHTPKM
jgi:RNA polymerase sigma factor (sigma-70 family)